MTPERKNAEEFVDNYKFDFISSDYQYSYSEREVYKLVEEYGKQQWNEAIKLAAENLNLLIDGKSLCSPRFLIEKDDTFYSETEIDVDKESILKLLK